MNPFSIPNCTETLAQRLHHELSENGYVQTSVEEFQQRIDTAVELSAWLQTWSVEWREYVMGQSRRHKLAPVVYTVSEYSPHSHIPTHHELSYLQAPPRWLIFYAHQPCTMGEMLLLDGVEVFRQLKEHPIWSTFLNREVLYRKCMPRAAHIGFGKTWAEHFEVSDPRAVESYLLSHGIRYSWTEQGGLSIETCQPLCRVFSEEHSPVWFAQLRLWHLGYRGLRWFEDALPRSQWPTDVIWASGEEIDLSFLRWIEAVEKASSHRVFLQKGDLLIVDNHRVAHGRTAFEGSREHWVAMGG